MPQVFICYSRKNIDIACELAKDLEKADFDVWWDISDLKGGDAWVWTIQAALKASKYCVVVLSPDAVESDWVEKDYTYAIHRGVKIITILYKTCEVPLALGNIRPIDFRGNKYDRGLRELLIALQAPPDTTVPDVVRRPEEGPKRERILHLSDIHLGTMSQAQRYFAQLKADLMQELCIRQLDYLVISGDVASNSTKEEYEAALKLVSRVVKDFDLDSTKIIAVPGNHDVNWDLSEEAYSFVFKRKLPLELPEGCYIPAGNVGVLLRDDKKYKHRSANFKEYFYDRVCNNEYPLDYADQAVLHLYPESRILFLALNSAWEIDHHFETRAGINVEALTKALNKLLDARNDYKGWLKIAIWHHPVTGPEQMKNTQFLEQLAVHGFQIVMHGHIHAAEHGFYTYDFARGIHIIGAGTFGAPTHQQVPGIPLQYNLLVLNPVMGRITVETRKKEKPNGAWSADARWGDRNNPVPRYEVAVKAWVVS